uniref:Programmed cell death protein 2 n=1 Tax=Parasteatoda tepidariorum TaxID=114398 RepID=A0A2L2Y6Z8_PARTP
MAVAPTELGFVEKRASWKLRSKFFPSKVGGFPAWLRLSNLPNRTDLLCQVCNHPLTFLLQVYAPVFELEEAFHRTIYIFMCRNSSCNKTSSRINFSVFRNQLPRKNEFYSFEPPEFNEKSSMQPCADQFQKMCAICGCCAILNCHKCAQIDYCCEDHKTLDWEWNHIHNCPSEKKEIPEKKKLINHFLLSEFELVTETEESLPDVPEKSDEEKMKDYQKFLQSSSSKELQDMPVGDLGYVEEKKDKAFNKFQKRVKLEPEQVLRYQKGGVPLWVSSENVPSENDIPNCSCGAKRHFEFQVMPQLLNYLSLDSVQESIDWGTLIIYTCSASCSAGVDTYVKEFLWKQDFSDVSLTMQQ